MANIFGLKGKEFWKKLVTTGDSDKLEDGEGNVLPIVTTQELDDKASLLQSDIDAFANGEGKTYTSLTTAMAVSPLPENNTPFRVDGNTANDGNYIYDSSNANGYTFLSELIVKEVGNLDPTNSIKVVTGKNVGDFTGVTALTDRIIEWIKSEEFQILDERVLTTSGVSLPRYITWPNGVIGNLSFLFVTDGLITSLRYNYGSYLTDAPTYIKRDIDYANQFPLETFTLIGF